MNWDLLMPPSSDRLALLQVRSILQQLGLDSTINDSIIVKEVGEGQLNTFTETLKKKGPWVPAVNVKGQILQINLNICDLGQVRLKLNRRHRRFV